MACLVKVTTVVLNEGLILASSRLNQVIKAMDTSNSLSSAPLPPPASAPVRRKRHTSHWHQEECQRLQQLWYQYMAQAIAQPASKVNWSKNQEAMAGALNSVANPKAVQRSGTAIGSHVRGRKCKNGCAVLPSVQATRAALAAGQGKASKTVPPTVAPINAAADNSETSDSTDFQESQLSQQSLAIGIWDDDLLSSTSGAMDTSDSDSSWSPFTGPTPTYMPDVTPLDPRELLEAMDQGMLGL